MEMTGVLKLLVAEVGEVIMSGFFDEEDLLENLQKQGLHRAEERFKSKPDK